MASKTEIANMAVRFCGIGYAIGDIETEESSEARSIRAFFDTALREFLEEQWWTWATKFATLALVTNNPSVHWAYAYQVPEDCVCAREIQNPAIKITHNIDRVPFRIVDGVTHSQAGRVLYCDIANPVLEYTYLLTDVSKLPGAATIALGHLLAHYIANDQTLGVRPDISERERQLYVAKLKVASRTDKGEAFESPKLESEYTSARRG